MSEGLTPREALEVLESWVESEGDSEREAKRVLLALIERVEHVTALAGPTVYATLARVRTDVPTQAVTAEVSSYLDAAQRQMSVGVGRAMQALYVDALRDGFVQGVAAECAQREKGGEP